MIRRCALRHNHLLLIPYRMILTSAPTTPCFPSYSRIPMIRRDTFVPHFSHRTHTPSIGANKMNGIIKAHWNIHSWTFCVDHYRTVFGVSSTSHVAFTAGLRLWQRSGLRLTTVFEVFKKNIRSGWISLKLLAKKYCARRMKNYDNGNVTWGYCANLDVKKLTSVSQECMFQSAFITPSTP